MRKVFLLVLLQVLLFTPSIFSGMSQKGAILDYIPQPRLLCPIKEEIDISGKQNLEFKWSSHEGLRFGRDYFDFRIYKGYRMMADTLIFKKKVAPQDYSISIESALFKDGEVYTWSLRDVYSGLGKSDRSFAAFKVIKK